MTENRSRLSSDTIAPGSDDSLVIDCDTCDVRGPAMCRDCVVAHLLGTDTGAIAAPSPQPVVLRLVEARGLERLAAAGLVPPLLHRRGA